MCKKQPNSRRTTITIDNFNNRSTLYLINRHIQIQFTSCCHRTPLHSWNPIPKPGSQINVNTSDNSSLVCALFSILTPGNMFTMRTFFSSQYIPDLDAHNQNVLRPDTDNEQSSRQLQDRVQAHHTGSRTPQPRNTQTQARNSRPAHAGQCRRERTIAMHTRPVTKAVLEPPDNAEPHHKNNGTHTHTHTHTRTNTHAHPITRPGEPTCASANASPTSRHEEHKSHLPR